MRGQDRAELAAGLFGIGQRFEDEHLQVRDRGQARW
jgi:hypothetical protein